MIVAPALLAGLAVSAPVPRALASRCGTVALAPLRRRRRPVPPPRRSRRDDCARSRQRTAAGRSASRRRGGRRGTADPPADRRAAARGACSLWSQMHGDEPSATPALLDVVDTLLSGVPGGDAILDRLTLLIVPMLNPTAPPATRAATRRASTSTETRSSSRRRGPRPQVDTRPLLAGARLQPSRPGPAHRGGRHGRPASIALLAVAGDPQGTLTPGRARARRVASLVARTVSPYVPGGVARYDEEWNPRAFGDNVTAWGTPVVLIESGGLLAGRPFTDLTRLNYVALLVVLDALARDDAAGEDPAVYEGLRRNTERLYVDVLIEGGRVAQPDGARAVPRRRGVRRARRRPRSVPDAPRPAGRRRRLPRACAR